MRSAAWAPQGIPWWLVGATAGALLAGAVLAEPWLWPRPVGGLFFRWHEAATVALVLAALAGVAIGRRLARIDLGALLLTACIGSFHLMALRIGPLNLLNVCIVLLLLWWLIDLQHTADAPRETPLLAHLLVAFAVLAMVSVLGAQQSPRGLVALLPKLAMAWMMLRLLRTDTAVRLAVRALIVTAVLSAGVGMAQSAAFVLYGAELHLMEDESPRFIAVLGFNFLRSSGLLSNPQAFCHVLSWGFLLLAYQCLVRPEGQRRASLWAVGGLLVMAAAIVLSFARGPWIAVALGLLAMPAVAWPRRAFHWFTALGVLAVIALCSGLLSAGLSAFRGFTLANTEARIELLATSIQMLGEHPWRGIGLANFQFFSPALERYPVHNAPMQVAAEMGVPGLLVFMAILCAPVAQAVGALKTASGPQAHLLKAVLLAYLVYMIQIQGEPSGYSELLFFAVVLLHSTARMARAASLTATAPSSAPASLSPRSP